MKANAKSPRPTKAQQLGGAPAASSAVVESRAEPRARSPDEIAE